MYLEPTPPPSDNPDAAAELASFDASRAGTEADPIAVAAFLEEVAKSLVERRPPPMSPAAAAMSFRVAAALLRRDTMPPTPTWSRTPDVEHLEDIADRLAEIGGPADLIRAGVARRIAYELSASLLATRAAADVWDAAAAFASKGLAGSAGSRQRFGDRMRAERNRRFPKLTATGQPAPPPFASQGLTNLPGTPGTPGAPLPGEL